MGCLQQKFQSFDGPYHHSNCPLDVLPNSKAAQQAPDTGSGGKEDATVDRKMSRSGKVPTKGQAAGGESCWGVSMNTHSRAIASRGRLGANSISLSLRDSSFGGRECQVNS